MTNAVYGNSPIGSTSTSNSQCVTPNKANARDAKSFGAILGGGSAGKKGHSSPIGGNPSFGMSMGGMSHMSGNMGMGNIGGNSGRIGGNSGHIGGNPGHIGGNPGHIGGNPGRIGGESHGSSNGRSGSIGGNHDNDNNRANSSSNSNKVVCAPSAGQFVSNQTIGNAVNGQWC